MKRILLSLLLFITSISPSNAATLNNCTTVKRDVAVVKGSYLQCLANTDLAFFESFRGPMVVNFWGSWCAPCRQELPLLRSAYRSGKVKIIGIDVDEPNTQNGKDFAIKAGITWPNLEDPSGKTKSSFGMGVPVTWF